MYIYAIGSIRSFYDYFEEALVSVDLSGENILVLMGDYIRFGPDSYKILDRIMALEEEYGTEKVIVLRGGRETWTLQYKWSITSFEKDDSGKDTKYLKWFKTLRAFYIKDNYLFYNRGVEDEMETLLNPLLRKWIVEQYADKNYDRPMNLFTVTNHHAGYNNTFEKNLNFTIERWKKQCIDVLGFVDEGRLKEIELKCKCPQVIKFDPHNDTGANRYFGWDEVTVDRDMDIEICLKFFNYRGAY
jgi:hypothetical protein